MRFVLLIFFWLCLNAAPAQLPTTYEIDGVQIHFLQQPPPDLEKVTQYFPVMREDLVVLIKERIATFMKKYPPGLIRKCISHIYVCDHFEYNGRSYSGVTPRGRECILLAMPLRRMRHSDFWSRKEGTFHHELSHSIYHYYEYRFKKRKWENENTLPYFDHYVKTSTRLDSNLCVQGFLTEYGRTNMPEDVAVFAGFMFTGMPQAFEYIDRFKRVKAKYQLLVAFYHKIDPVFTDDYFRSFRDAALKLKARESDIPDND